MRANKRVIAGRIEVSPGCDAIGRDLWIEVVAAHPCLSPPTPVAGINPFTRKPVQFKASADTAIISIDGCRIGSIFSAMDGSTMLFVTADDDSAEVKAHVTRIAEDVASQLGGIFTPWKPTWL